MANLKNAKKRILVNKKKEERNNNYLASAKTAVKNVERAVAKKDKGAAEDNLKIAIKRIDKAAGAHVMNKNTSARKKSRLTKKVNAME
ncbi:MAG: 30S ribosomal protein S20 [Bacilli bacterium]|nr:30S ribosomal protein S20 [Bacilli bacterium]